MSLSPLVESPSQVNHFIHSHRETKSLIDIAGKPMIQWVLDTVSQAKHIERVAVVGLVLSEDEGLDGSVTLSCSKPLNILPNQHDMVENIRAGVQAILEMNPDVDYAMTSTSDISLVTGEMFDWFIEQT